MRSQVVKRLLLVDDHAVVRLGICALFADCADLVVDCQAGDGREAMALLRSRPIDAVLLDLSMPRQGGLETLRRMRAERPELPILIVSMHAEEQYALNVLKAGASGYLSKWDAPERLVTATRVVLDGRKYLSDALAAELAMAVGPARANPEAHKRLSPREFDVFCQLARGEPAASIADALAIPVKTCATHRKRILARMCLARNADPTHHAIARSIIE